jgi:hypothetical protein
MERLSDKQYQKQHYKEELYKVIGYAKIMSFLEATRELGADVMCIDVTHYGFAGDAVPACIYALKGKKLIGAICKSGTKIVDGYDSGFQSKGRKFLTLDI